MEEGLVVTRMIVKCVIVVLALGICLVLYCCLRVGAQADRWMESMERERKEEEYVRRP